MSANVEAMVREGVAAFKEGRSEEARVLLSKAVELDQYNEQAWLWLSGVVEAPDDQRVCLENVLAINPLNERAKKGLAHLNGQSVDFAPPKPPARQIETSVEWDSPSDSKPRPAPTAANPGTLSDEEYDNWVTGLNLPAGSPVAAADGTTSPFTDVNFDEFDNGPFGSVSPNTGVPPAPRRMFEFGTPPPALNTQEEIDAINLAAAPSAKERKRASRESRRASAEMKRANAESSIKKTSADLFIPDPDDRDYTLFNDIDPDADGEPMEAGEGALFSIIPLEIRATRVPGTRERLPLIGMLMLVALIVFNIGALGVLVRDVIQTVSQIVSPSA